MREYHPHLSHYADHWAMDFCPELSSAAWGDKKVAAAYLEKYWLPQAEYQAYWKPLQDQLFINQDKLCCHPDGALAQMLFDSSYKVLALRGGFTLCEEYYQALQQCMHRLGNKHFVVIESRFGLADPEPAFRMKYPVDISWKELSQGGNFISAFLFDVSVKEYFVFGDTLDWAWYAANDGPLVLLAFKEKHAALFAPLFRAPQQEWAAILQKLPPIYQARVRQDDAVIAPMGKRTLTLPPKTSPSLIRGFVAKHSHINPNYEETLHRETDL